MEVVYQSERSYLLRFDPGEEMMAELRSWCDTNDIQGGELSVIGAAATVELQFFSTETKEYTTQELAGETFEIASVLGNIARHEDGVVIHAHGVFSTPSAVYAGHINSMVVAATGEVSLRVFDRPVHREFSEEIGLKILTRDE